MAEVQLSTLGAVIKTAYEGQDNTNAFTDAEKTKLAGIQAGAEVNSVLTVNGVEPDGDGNITIPTGGGDVVSVNTVEPDSDGNITLTKTNIGLGNVDNTSDANKPVSTATQTAITTAVAGVTKTSIGLGNVDNTSDANKPVSTAQQTAIDAAVEGMVVSDTTGVAGADVITNVISLTQAEYDEIDVPDTATLYVIVG
jgi:hypothetical protein